MRLVSEKKPESESKRIPLVSRASLMSKLTEARMQQAAVRARLYAELRKALYGDVEPEIE